MRIAKLRGRRRYEDVEDIRGLKGSDKFLSLEKLEARETGLLYIYI